MAFAPPVKVKPTMGSTQLAKSTWTPMNNSASNNHVFEERREIIKKWFQKWHESQKTIIVGDILQSLSTKQMTELHDVLNSKFPREQFDFSRILPRVLTLYLFSFLDPRTLCRCSQVSWYWNYLTELDCLWRPKCLRFGWYPTYQPTPFEEKIWKRFYVNTVHELHYAKPKTKEAYDTENKPPGTGVNTARSDTSRLSTARSINSNSTVGRKRGPVVPSTKRPLPAAKWEPPPWRGSDPHPIDTVRYNYLDNMQKKGMDGRSMSASRRRPTSATGSRRPLTSGKSPRPSSGDPLMKTTKFSAEPRKISASICSQDFTEECINVLHSSLQANSAIKNGSESPQKSAVNEEKDCSPAAPFANPDISRLSIDAGVRPGPVAKPLLVEKPKQSSSPVKSARPDNARKTFKTADDSEKLALASSTSPAPVATDKSLDLQGSAWKPAKSISDDDEDF